MLLGNVVLVAQWPCLNFAIYATYMSPCLCRWLDGLLSWQCPALRIMFVYGEKLVLKRIVNGSHDYAASCLKMKSSRVKTWCFYGLNNANNDIAVAEILHGFVLLSNLYHQWSLRTLQWNLLRTLTEDISWECNNAMHMHSMCYIEV